MKPKRQRVWTLNTYVVMTHDGEPTDCYPKAPAFPISHLTREKAVSYAKKDRRPEEKPYRVQRATLTLALEDDK